MPTKRKATKARARARAKRTGPSISQLIVEIISKSSERTGMSLPTIKKALSNSGYDAKKNQGRIRVAVRSLVNKGVLVQTKGMGASASYKINEAGAVPPPRRPRPKAKRRAGKKRRAAKRSSKKPKKGRKAKKSKRQRKARRRPKKAGKRRRARKATAKKGAKRKARKTASKTN